MKALWLCPIMLPEFADFFHEKKNPKALDKLEALIQHNESPIDTWSENEYELNKTYAFNVVDYSEWLQDLRQEILKDTLIKIESEKPDGKGLLEAK